MSDVQIAIIDQENIEVNLAVPGIQGAKGDTGTVAAAGDGTAAAPGISFASDTNTGIYRPGADQLAISTGGTGRLFVDASGNVGIGSGADLANSNMHLVRGAGAAAYMAFTGNNNTITAAGLLVGQSGGGESRLFQYGNNPITFYTQSLERLRLTGDGRLGIGTSSPGSILDIKVNNSSTVIGGSASVVRVNNGSGVIGATSGIEFFHGNDTSSNTTRLAGVYGRYASFNASGLGGELVFATNTAGDSTIDQRMVIDSSGRVGIGTTSPGVSLDVSNSGSAQIRATTTDTSGLSIGGFEGKFTGGGGGTASSVLLRAGDAYTLVGSSTNTPLLFITNNGEKARIDTSGNVGIGTSAPVNLLDVNGAVGVTYTNGLRLFRNTGTVNNAILQHVFTGGNDQLEIAPAGNVATSAIALRTATGSVVGTRMFISPAGNVGIGTQSPGVALDIANGDLRIKRSATNDGAVYFGSTLSNYIFSGNSNNIMAFAVNGSEAARLDASGRLLVGTSSAYGSATLLELHSSTQFGPQFLQRSKRDDVFPTYFIGQKIRNTSPVQSGDSLASFVGEGYDGASYIAAARIDFSVDGTPGTNDMPGRLVFATTADGAAIPTEKMRIDKDGATLIGTTSINGAAGLTFRPNITEGSAQIVFNRNTTTNTSFCVLFKNAGTDSGSISYTNTAVAYNTSSDYRLKENVVPLTGAIDRVNQLQVHRFNFIADPDKTVDGFIAHEAQAIVPECITGEKDAVDDEGNPVYQGIDQSKLVPLLTAALQEAIAKIETLEAKVAALEAQ